MKKTAVVFALIVLSMVIILPFSLNLQEANAQTSTYTIQDVEHNVRVLYSGHVVITEKIQLSGSAPSTFDLGLPFRYGSYLLQGTAYDSNNNALPVTLGVQLQGQSGFYGVSVALPSGTSAFTVFFVLSNDALITTSDGYTLDFPAYLGFSQPVSSYHGNLTFPSGASIVGIDKPDGVVNATTYTKQNLPAFTYSPATASISASAGVIQEVNILTLTRQLNIHPAGDVTCTDTYKIDNNSTRSINSFLLNLPLDASNVVARDEFGRLLSASVQQSNSLVLVYNVTLEAPIGIDTSNLLILDYSLPSISPAQPSEYVLDVDLFPYFNYYVDAVSVTVTPPEGATITSPELSQLGASAGLLRGTFQESVTINKAGVSFINSVVSSDVVSVAFTYNSLWIAFRPTTWMWAIGLVGAVFVAVWTRPKTKVKRIAAPKVTLPKAPVGVALSSEHLQDFVEAYEEKQKLNRELRALDARARHGRIPRRRYKVQRRTLELRIESLMHTIVNVKAILSSAGGSYAEIARQIEAADVELNEVELSLQTLEARHESAEISLETYNRQLSELERRRDKADEAISGLLSRLRGELQ
jgi:hypothetical protein